MDSPIAVRRSARIAATKVVVPDAPKKVKLTDEQLKERRLEAFRRGFVTRKLCFEKLEKLPFVLLGQQFGKMGIEDKMVVKSDPEKEFAGFCESLCDITALPAL